MESRTRFDRVEEGRSRRRSRPIRRVSAAVALVVPLLAVATGVVATGASGAGLSEAVLVTAPGEGGGDPVVVASADGDVTAVWTTDGSPATVRTATWQVATRSWGATGRIGRVAGATARVAAAGAADGRVVAVWDRAPGPSGSHVATASVYDPDDGTWSPPTDLVGADPGAPDVPPIVAVGTGGRAAAAWWRAGGRLQVAVLDAGSSRWAAPVEVASTADPGSAALTVDPSGAVTAVWVDTGALVAARLDALAPGWGSPSELGPAAAGAPAPVGLVADGAGDVTAVWSVAGPTTSVRSARWQAAPAAWSDAVTLPVDAGADLQVAGNADGRVVVAGIRDVQPADRAVIGAAFAPRGATWQPIPPLPLAGAAIHTCPAFCPTGQALRGVVMDPVGDVTVLYATWELLVSGLFVATLPVGGAWAGHERMLTPASERTGADLGVDAAGDVTSVFVDTEIGDRLLAVRLVAGLGFRALGPVRAFDTRPGASPGAAFDERREPLDGVHELPVAFAGYARLVPSTGVAAVALDVATVGLAADGYLAVYPCGERPTVSNVAVRAAAVVSNAVVVPLAPDGTVCFFSSVPADLVVDVHGWFTGSGLVGMRPVRLFDTRPGQSPAAVRSVPAGPVGGDHVLEVSTVGGALQVPERASSVVLNVTAVGAEAAGFVTVHPCGSARPQVSTLNLVPGEVVTNLAVVAPSAAGTVCFSSSSRTDLVVDVMGWAPPDLRGTGAPVRLFDTRPGQSPGAKRAVAGPLGAGRVIEVEVTGLGAAVPDAAVDAVVLNVTAIEPAADGFVTVYPCGLRPPTSSLDVRKGEIVAGAVVAPVSADGTVCLFSSVPTDVVVDLSGWSGRV